MASKKTTNKAKQRRMYELKIQKNKASEKYIIKKVKNKANLGN